MVEYGVLVAPALISIVVCVIFLKQCTTKEKFVACSIYLTLCIWSTFCLWSRLTNPGNEILICTLALGSVVLFLWNIQCSKRFFANGAFEAWKIGCFLMCFIGTTTIFGSYYINSVMNLESTGVDWWIWNDILPDYLLYGVNYFCIGLWSYFFKIDSAMFILQALVGAIWLSVIVPPVFSFMKKILVNETVKAEIKSVVDLNEERSKRKSTPKNYVLQRQKSATGRTGTRNTGHEAMSEFFEQFEKVK